MKVQIPQIQPNNQEKNRFRKNPPLRFGSGRDISFGGPVENAFQVFWKFLDTNKAWGANAVDIGAMVLPRTLVDFTRGPAAGTETMRREMSGTTNHTLIGTYGLIAAGLLGYGLDKTFPGVKVNKMFISNDNIDIMAKLWSKHFNREKEDLDGYLKNITDRIRGFNPDTKKRTGWIGLGESKSKVVEVLKDELTKNTKLNKDTKAYIKALIIRDTGAESKFTIESGLERLDTKALSLDTLIDDIYKFARAAKSPKVLETFKVQNLADNTFIKRLKSLNTQTALLGLGMAVLAGICVQPFNMYLTKKKTGKSGFVGVEGREQDNSAGFKILKSAAAVTFALGALGTIGKKSGDIFNKLQFKGFTPTIEQFKLVYGLTIMSRLLSARDKNELRETSIKDTLGFLNWLVFGGFVAKLAALGFEKITKYKLINYNEKSNGKGWFNWITRSAIKTRDEILHTDLKSVGKETFKNARAFSFKKLLRLAKEHAPQAKTKIMYINIAQLIGYLYAGLILGRGIPKLNIAITNAVEGKKKNNTSTQQLNNKFLDEKIKKPDVFTTLHDSTQGSLKAFYAKRHYEPVKN